MTPIDLVTGDKNVAASLALMLFGIYMIGFDGTLHSSDGLSMFAVAENIVKHGSFDTRQLLSWGNVALGIDNLPYTVFPIGPSLLILFFVALSLALPNLGSVQTTLVLMPLSGASLGSDSAKASIGQTG